MAGSWAGAMGSAIHASTFSAMPSIMTATAGRESGTTGRRAGFDRNFIARLGWRGGEGGDASHVAAGVSMLVHRVT